MFCLGFSCICVILLRHFKCIAIHKLPCIKRIIRAHWSIWNTVVFTICTWGGSFQPPVSGNDSVVESSTAYSLVPGIFYLLTLSYPYSCCYCHFLSHSCQICHLSTSSLRVYLFQEAFGPHWSLCVLNYWKTFGQFNIHFLFLPYLILPLSYLISPLTSSTTVPCFKLCTFQST